MSGRRVRIIGGIAAAVLLGGSAWALFNGRTVAPAAPAPAPRFVDESAASGVDHTYDGDSRFFVGGGVAVLDCNADGMPDLYLAGGAGPAALFRNESPIAGALSFARVPGAATDLPDVTGAYPLDIDGDGLTDLAVLRAGENVLLRGTGDCGFERANERWSFDGGAGRTMAFSATWEGDARMPTLAIGDYIALDAIGTPLPPCPDNQMLRPADDDAGYGAPIPLAPGYCPLSMLFSDWDRSGRRDLRVSNDRQYYEGGQEQLWRVSAGSEPALYDGDDGWARMQIWGMGIASRDLTGDGYPEIYLTSQGDNKLQMLLADASAPTYRDVAVSAGVNAAQPIAGGETLPSTAWHPEFADVNNDGFVDLLVTKGNVSEQAGHATRDPSELFLGRADGTFVQAAEEAGILRFDRGRGAAVVDLNLDGLPDVVEVYLGAPVGVWRNVGAGSVDDPRPMGHWLALRLAQPGPNPDAVGAWVEIRLGETTLHHELTVGGGHLSGQSGWIHFGLGRSERAEVRVTWPDGTQGPWQMLDADVFAILERDGAPREWSPRNGETP
ncbi:MAG: CRTAC1 family protein [Chloroflexi bacterium]|nr:CRTAC1 family protein [Chloroflexota bacterium]